VSLALGIDTGGTYTDAVLVEYETGRVLATAKALTTRQDLAIGIRQAVARILRSGGAGEAGRPAPEIGLVSLSTTLATNAIVEGNGAPICALMIGYGHRLGRDVDLARELGTPRLAMIGGGHDGTGEELAPLDLHAARQAIAEHAPHVAAFAVSGYFGTRNPAHELAVKQLAAELTGLPVTCGHELTHRLDALRRATTVTLNARLIPLICDLIAAVQRIMDEEGIAAPLMVVKGDGSLMDATLAVERPIETILSGPAASVVGARHLAGGSELLVVDMGGTTTDIALIEDGRPRLSASGAQVGRWRTMVEAIAVHTAGIGGDSRVTLDAAGELAIGPRRVVPVCLLAAEHPTVAGDLAAQLAAPQPAATDGEFLVLQRPDARHDGDHPAFEAELMAALRARPLPLAHAYEIIRYPELYARYLDRLISQGTLLRAGFTPTDAAHVLSEYSAWDAAAARQAAELLARRCGAEPADLCRRVIARTAEAIAREIVDKLLADEQDGGDGDGKRALVDRAFGGRPGSRLACRLALGPELVAIGAPVSTYFPMVAHLLNGRLRLPEHAEVANAIGAVAGSVVQRVHALIVPLGDDEGMRVHLPDETHDCPSQNAALEYAGVRLHALAEAGARRAGAEDVRIQLRRTDHRAPVAEGWGQEVMISIDLEAVAIGRPHLARHEPNA
jgi:N-methylhydantoinase A/oxoprolinase/acetone carboxylase beta subunit